jgi:hypothetical protein
MKEYVMYKPIIEDGKKFFMDGVWTIKSEEDNFIYLEMGSIIIRVTKDIIDKHFLDNKLYSSRLKQGDILTLQTPEGYIDYFEIQSIDWKNSAYGTIYFKVS